MLMCCTLLLVVFFFFPCSLESEYLGRILCLVVHHREESRQSFHSPPLHILQPWWSPAEA